MVTSEEENYLRSALLLLKGCRCIALKVLQREEEHERSRSNRNIDDVLHAVKNKLKYKFPNHKQREMLFTESQQIEVDKWDIGMIATVLLFCFRESLQQAEVDALKSIKYQRNEVHAHKVLPSLSTDEFEEISRELQKTITTLSDRFDNSVKDECAKIVDECLNGSLQGDIKACLKSLPDTDNLLDQILQTAERTEKSILELKEELPKIFERVIREVQSKGETMKTIKVIDSELTVSGTANDAENVKLAEEVIRRVTNEAIRRVGSAAEHQKIRVVIDEILQEIESSGVQVLRAEKGCVLIRLRCTSYQQILDLFKMKKKSYTYRHRLQALAEALQQCLSFSARPVIKIALSHMSMYSLLEDIGRASTIRCEQSLRVGLECKTYDSILHVLEVFQGTTMADSMSKLSKSVSEHVKANIKVKSSLDVQQLQPMLSEES